MTNDWEVIKRNVSVCNVCENMMSLWKDKRTGQYSIICEWCSNEFIFEKVVENEKNN